MASEEFTVVALPRSAAPERRFHVSLFISPRLTPDGAGGKLREFPRFKRWSETLAGAEIRILGGSSADGSGGQEIAATPLLDRLRPQLWRKVFPGTTPVRGRPEPEMPDELLSYAAHKVDQNALNLHTAALLQAPVELPRPLGPALREVVALQLAFARPPGLEALKLERILEPRSELQARFTEYLDDPGDGEHLIRAAPGLSRAATVSGGFFEQVLDAHRANRYYEQLAPPATTSVPSPPEPDPDFHERCSLLAGTPRLLRWLGLVIDLRVEDLDALRQLSWIRGRIAIDEADPDQGPARRPRTACHSRGRGFFASPATDEWSDGWLRLSHPDGRYEVLDLDPDASALKLERHLRNLVRLAAAEQNGDPASGAPPALRAAGFSIARRDRDRRLAESLEFASRQADAREQGADEPIHLEELARGLRLEVWDDASEAWHSLHQRRIDVEVGGEEIADGVGDVGFLQGGTLAQKLDENGEPDEDAPHQLHEVIAGWQGWSLSAPPPGKTILDADGAVGAPPLASGAADSVEIRSRVKRGTLPRLRYGRSYAFRLASVDLAGNSPPHSLGEGAGPSPELRTALGPLLELRAATGDPSPFEQELLSALRAAQPLGDAEPEGPPREVDLEGAGITGHIGLDRLILRRSGSRAERRLNPGTTRRERVERAFTRALHETGKTLAPTAPELDPITAASLLGIFGELFDQPEEMIEAVELYLDFVSKPRPFLRWDPVAPPTVVPRHPFSLGESLLTLVIRSGVRVPNEIAISPPQDYAAAHPGFDYRATSERHLAAPKSSQREAEFHGEFDGAIGSSGAAAHRTALGIALREEGTFSDKKIADLERPGKFVPQPKVSKVGGPAAEGKAEYFIHDVDQLALPYLPDPLATGVSLVFPDAGRDHRLEFPWTVEGLRLGYRRGWPEPRPYRLVLESGKRLEGRVDGNAIRIALPPGTQLRLRTSSALRRDELGLLGLWRTRPPEYRERIEIAEAAADGWLWWLTPYDEIRLVHAVPRPIEVPKVVGLEPRGDLPDQRRVADDTGCGLQAVIDLHAPSTGRVDLEASWSEPVDELTADAPEEVAGGSTPWGVDVEPDEDFLALLPPPTAGKVTLPDGDVVRLHGVRHEFGDTKHRMVSYRVRGTTRFREHFDPALGIEDLSVVGPSSRVSIPSSSRPPKPVVRDVLPLFRWGERTEPAQPFGLRRTRRSGLRIYLERPWYATGEGELLGVVLGPVRGDPEPGTVPVSVWAADPVWKQRGPLFDQFLPLQDALEAFEPELPDEPGRPVLASGRLPVIGIDGDPTVEVLGYRPEYNRERKLWFVDVAFDQRTAFWPFTRLALARFQPDSIEGKHLSPIVTSDFMQVAPDRLATLSWPDERNVRVVVTGPVGYPREIPNPIGDGDDVTPAEERVNQSRRVRARLERRDPDLGGSDLGWEALAQTNLELRGFENWTASWLGTIALPRAMAPRRPGSRANWRVTVEEWERLRADPPPGTERAPFRSEARLVYADHLYL